MSQTFDTDVAIIGTGPVGLFAVFECGMLRLRSVLVDALAEVGGQCTALYPEKPIYDIPAHPAISAGALVEHLERQIAPFAPPRLLGRRVERLVGEAGAFTLGTDQGDTVRARAVVIAAGAGAFRPTLPRHQAELGTAAPTREHLGHDDRQPGSASTERPAARAASAARSPAHPSRTEGPASLLVRLLARRPASRDVEDAPRGGNFVPEHLAWPLLGGAAYHPKAA